MTVGRHKGAVYTLSSKEVPCLRPLLLTGQQTWKFWLSFWLGVLPQRHRHTPSQREYPLNHWFLVPVLVRWLPAVRRLPLELLGQWPLGRRWSPAPQPCRLPPFLRSVGPLMFCVRSQHSSSVPKPALMKVSNRKWPCKSKSTQKAQRRGGQHIELLSQRNLERSSRERMPP